ncbi:phosphoethanolamine transferase [Pseudomonas sp. LPB0260]|uniref:phosphoethanolamine transferase n=1 Tax=Pseudomonas sp. LPB0260 TaxID=2614442 RepID=UPI002115529F|nr:phosphoethanolamine--lipid A transferase [Pseudomonas sp. LPB0260]
MLPTSQTRNLATAPAAWTLSVSRPLMTLLTALWLLLFSNLPFWRDVWQGVDGLDNGNWLFLLSLPLFAWLWLYLLLSLLAWGRMTKAVLGAMLLVSAAASYFMGRYGIVIDSSMLTNVLQTDGAEAAELLSWRLLVWLALVGGLPLLALSRLRSRPRGWRRELGIKLGSMVLALVCLLGIALSQYQSYASLLRNHHELRLLLTPSNVLAALHGYLRRELQAPPRLQVIGADAHRLASVGAARKPRLTVLLVGETARAANFSLNGYARETSPELAKAGVISFSHVSSCGTATAVSVPCMFLEVGRDQYQESMSRNREGLLDVLQRAGVRVLWRDNNSGCKGACDRVPSEDVSHLELADLCADGECHDEVLLSGLQGYLDKLDDDAVVVLHMKGSHGPAYYKRYPAAFEKFVPVCRSNELDQCSSQSIVNAYDNSLAYTDHVLAQTVALLERNAARLDTAMLYVSDHGESLGEGGLYLHGLPYAMAPDEQTHVPMILWVSEGLLRQEGLQAHCLTGLKDQRLSHDNLFHSVLGLMAVQTSTYRPERDLFRQCLAPQQAAAQMDSAASRVN